MQHESSGCFTCECGHFYELRWSQIQFGESWQCWYCSRILQVGCAEQWEPTEPVVSAPKNNVIEIRRAA